VTTPPIQVLDDFDDAALRQKVLRRALLREWLAHASVRDGIRSVEVTLLETEYTCGQGHEPDALAGLMLCVPCREHSYKQALDNSSCTPCPASSFTNWSNATLRDSVEVCRCERGLRPLSAGSIPRKIEDASGSSSADASGVDDGVASNLSYWTGRAAWDRIEGLESQRSCQNLALARRSAPVSPCSDVNESKIGNLRMLSMHDVLDI
jgi:hypothetical protein